MSRIVPAGSLSWIHSQSPDVAGYFVYYQEDAEPTYGSPAVDVGMTSIVHLPLQGQTPIEGDFYYGIAAYDQKGNESDIVAIQVTLDTTPPAPPDGLTYTP